MKFNSLTIRNFRAIEYFQLQDIKDFVLIAGQNGCGKSCVLDGIRLLKSVYGGYSPNEHHQWFGEFAINVNDSKSVATVFRDPAQPLQVQANIEFTPAELTYIADNVKTLALPMAWQRITGQMLESWQFGMMSVGAQLEQQRGQVDAVLTEISRFVHEDIDRGVQSIGITIPPDGRIQLIPSKLVELAFQTFEPAHLGVIDHHSASRTYTRQSLGGVNLDARSFESQRRASTLYNSQAKFQNIKAELATSYLHELVARDAGTPPADGSSLNEALAELFDTFFPDKKYHGVAASSDGSLNFPVTLANERTHDIDDLSSGEKEILYGYLRLRGATPPNSVLLLDEPELHLNPGLLHGFADFYYRHLGETKGNQLWLVTHSDTLLRQAVGNPRYSVFHMTVASAVDSGENQANEVNISEDVERATMDLVGDLATYRPHSKVVIFEGDGANGFDVSVIRRLFPDFAKRVNLVSGGNKSRVGDLYELLGDATQSLAGENRFFAVTDMDRAPRAPGSNHVSWDRYHIENYLLDPTTIRTVTEALAGTTVFVDDQAVLDALRVAAEQLIDSLAVETVQSQINDQIVSAIRIGASPTNGRPETQLSASLGGSMERITAIADSFTEELVESLLDRARHQLREAFDTDEWLKKFPGRSILKRFASNNLPLGYEPFVNLILDEMSRARVEPQGMRTVLQQILDT